MRVPLCGDPAVGKTSLIRTLATGDFSLDEFDTSVPVDALNGKLQLVDTNCQEDSDRSRVAAYKDADAFLILFSVISPTSYNSVLTKWHPEILRANTEGKPVILVGTKSDLRSDPDALQRLEARHLAPTSYDQGLRLARQVGAVTYVECASPTASSGLLALQDALDALSSGRTKVKRSKSKSLNAATASSSKADAACCNLI